MLSKRGTTVSTVSRVVLCACIVLLLFTHSHCVVGWTMFLVVLLILSDVGRFAYSRWRKRHV